MKLTGRTVLITGGTSGIGLESAAQLLTRDNVVIATGRDDKGIGPAKNRHPGLHAFRSDVRDSMESGNCTDVSACFPQLRRRPALGDTAPFRTRLPAEYPKDYVEALANLYRRGPNCRSAEAAFGAA